MQIKGDLANGSSGFVRLLCLSHEEQWGGDCPRGLGVPGAGDRALTGRFSCPLCQCVNCDSVFIADNCASGEF